MTPVHLQTHVSLTEQLPAVQMLLTPPATTPISVSESWRTVSVFSLRVRLVLVFFMISREATAVPVQPAQDLAITGACGVHPPFGPVARAESART